MDADAPPAVVAEQRLHLRDPLRVGGAADAAAVRKKAGPVLPAAHVEAGGEAFAPQVLRALLRVPVVGIAPEPGSERLLLIRHRRGARHAPVDLRLGGKK